MTSRRFVIGIALALLGVPFFGACGSDVTAKDCKIQCGDTRTTCTQKCNEETCKTQCTTDFDHCSASCGSVTVKKDGG
jgi:hypothetical protein